ncbi:MAG: hypothetical protein L6Q33_11825, partial [Bacteriovoracaceae bacterium]|nr:hypothetical protein [Bacteriovoracaceae bacterium]
YFPLNRFWVKLQMHHHAIHRFSRSVVATYELIPTSFFLPVFQLKCSGGIFFTTNLTLKTLNVFGIIFTKIVTVFLLKENLEVDFAFGIWAALVHEE